MILVAGGTGRLGTLLVRRLARSGNEVRVLTRDPARAQHLGDAATDVVRGDVRDAASLVPAMRGVNTVVSAVHGMGGKGKVTPASVDREGNANLIDAAVGVSADVVLVSVIDASPDSRMELFRAKYAAEQHLRARSASWTIIRATAFLELWAEILARPVIPGRGRNPINFVSVHDVAAVVERAVVDPALRGRTLEVGGPDNLTLNRLVAELQAAGAASATVRHIPRWALRVAAPASRRAAMGLVMDTTDMTFDPATAGDSLAGLPMTGVRTALRAPAPDDFASSASLGTTRPLT